jgi:hypothetical protein
MPQTARDNGAMQTVGPGGDEAPFTFVDRPKASLRVVTVAVWLVSCFLLYKAVVEPPPEPWILWALLAFFALCGYGVIREFMLRPMRVTTVLRRRVVLEETAPWRKSRLVASIPPGAYFEIFSCDSDSDMSGVRIQSKDNGWLTIAEFVSKEDAELLARDANARLLGY